MRLYDEIKDYNNHYSRYGLERISVYQNQSKTCPPWSKGTNTYGRNGFSIHGGKSPGSAGCIDLTKDNNAFHNWLKSYGNTIILNVDYWNATDC